MSKKLKFTHLAKKDIQNIFNYLDQNWSLNDAANFNNTLKTNLNRISEVPTLFPYLRKDLEIQKCVVTKHNTIYFKEYPNWVTIIRVYDVRQNPKNLNL